MTSEEQPPPAEVDSDSSRPTRRRVGGSPGPGVTGRWLMRSLFAVVVALGLFTVFALIVRASVDDDSQVIGAARLTWNPATDDALGEGKAASVEIIADDGSYRVFIYDLEVLRSPADSEFIEAWLVPADDAVGVDRVSIGVFDEIRTRLFPIADGIDPRAYTTVELSLQDENNRGEYSGRTLLRGELVWLVDPPE